MIQLEENNSAEVLKEVGAELAALRLARGASIRDVSQKLRITPEYIEAIEQGDADAFSSMTYAIGYVRSYSGYLGVSADPFCQRLRDSLSVEQMRPEYEFVENKLSRGRGAGRTAFIAMIMLVSIYGGWYSWDAGLISQDDATPQLASVGDIVEEEPATTLDETPVIEPAEPEASSDAAINPEGEDIQARELPVAGVEATDADALETTTEQVATGKIASAEVEPASGGIETPASETPASVTPSEVTAENAADPAQDVTATPQPGQAVAHNRDPETEMVLRASATSWVEISRPDGSIVSAWLMRQGDEYTIPGDQDIYLTAGNAGGLEIELIGDEPKRLGEWGETISELPLDPTLLNSRY
jgi:cytoskeleton protein RodZ